MQKSTNKQPMTTLPSGAKLPLNGFGTWRAEPGEATRTVQAALATGYRHLDCAAVYFNEKEVGEALAAELASPTNPSGIPREDLFVTSKVWNTCHERSRVVDACRQTLSDLKLDYLDLYLMHFPFAFAGGDLPVTGENYAPKGEFGDPAWAKGISVLDTWRGLEDCINLGLVRHIGICNYSAALLMDLLQNSSIKPSVMQCEAHVYNTREQLREVCERYGVHFTMYSILGSGKAGPLQDEVVARIARERSITPAQVLLAWGIGRGCSVLAKSVHRERIEENFAAAECVLSEDELVELDGLDRGMVLCNQIEYWGFPSHV